MKEESPNTHGGKAMGCWAKPPMAREQIVLFAPTLDATIAEDHPVRLVDEILGRMDWTAWEAKYNGGRGQPPIPPRVVAGVLLYGLSRGVRSSRHLEYLIGNNLDFIWLAEGRRIDHSTLCQFRKEFHGPLKDLFRQVCRIAMTMGLIRLNEVAFMRVLRGLSVGQGLPDGQRPSRSLDLPRCA
jgi:transposase